jgi:predicted transcriptional regulator
LLKWGVGVESAANQGPHELLSVTRMDARLDSTTRQKVDELARHFHQPRAAILCHIMQWGLHHGQTGPLDQGDAQGPVCHLYLYVDAELHERVEKAATAVGMKIAPWLRHMVRQMTISDFPASWQEERSPERSHDSRTYGTRFLLRLDEPSQTKLQQLVDQFEASKAAIIRQLIAQVEPEDFPLSWQMRASERRVRTRDRSFWDIACV